MEPEVIHFTSWSISCKSDPRFTASGETTKMRSALDEINTFIEFKAKELGVEPPEDIHYGIWKN